jgi:hypothetical protein
MNKNEIIYKFIDEQVFPNTKWETYNFSYSNGGYVSCRSWCKIRDMFSISREEVEQHLNEYILTKVEGLLEFHVILEHDTSFNVLSSGNTWHVNTLITL